MEGLVKMVKLFLNHEADIDKQDYDTGETALMKACYSGEVFFATLEKSHVVKVLVAYNANINHQDKNGKTALMKASKKGNINVTKMTY